MSASKKSVRAHKAKRRPKSAHKAVAKLPDLDEILDAMYDASALITVASDAVMDGDGGAEACVLRIGVVALEEVIDQLEDAALKFDQFQKSNGAAA